MWDVRGGGLYACGFAATFIYLEMGSIVGDVKEIGSLLGGDVIDFVVGFFVDSLMNTISAFMWPVEVVQFAAPWGAIGLGFAYLGFPVFVKPTIEGWLFDDDPPADEDS